MTYELPLTGRRRDDTELGQQPDDMQPGDYWRGVHEALDHRWVVAIPGGPVGSLLLHRVIEHEDGTISVPPGENASGSGTNSIPGHTFHGYIERGVWYRAPGY